MLKRSTMILIASVLIFMLTFLAAGCSTSNNSSNQSASSNQNDKGKIVIGFASSGLNHPFQLSLKDGAQKAADKAGVKLVVVDAQDDPAKQQSDIEDLIQQKVSLIIINPVDSDAIVPAVQKCNDANIPVITVDRNSTGGNVLTYIASDNVAGAKMAAEYIAQMIGGKGNVVEIQGQAGSSAARDRGKGFHDGLSKYPDIKIVYSQPADWDRNKAMNVMQNALQAHKDIKAVFAHNDEMALGAMRAVEAAGLQGKVIIVGFDAIDEAVSAIKDGKMDATIQQQPELMGETAVNKALDYLKNKTKLPKFIPIDLKLIKK